MYVKCMYMYIHCFACLYLGTVVLLLSARCRRRRGSCKDAETAQTSAALERTQHKTGDSGEIRVYLAVSNVFIYVQIAEFILFCESADIFENQIKRIFLSR